MPATIISIPFISKAMPTTKATKITPKPGDAKVNMAIAIDIIPTNKRNILFADYLHILFLIKASTILTIPLIKRAIPTKSIIKLMLPRGICKSKDTKENNNST